VSSHAEKYKEVPLALFYKALIHSCRYCCHNPVISQMLQDSNTITFGVGMMGAGREEGKSSSPLGEQRRGEAERDHSAFLQPGLRILISLPLVTGLVSGIP
jgi:pyruvate-formate lyase-activating enzyme